MKALRWVIGAAAIAALGTTLWFATRPPPLTVQGEVSADRVDISPRVSGRVSRLGADTGDTVARGTVLVELESPQLVAALSAAQAALGVARADLDRVNSTRSETITARRADLASADADVTLYQDNYGRQAQLIRSGNTPQARLDEAARNLEAAVRKRESAEAALHLALRRGRPADPAPRRIRRPGRSASRSCHSGRRRRPRAGRAGLRRRAWMRRLSPRPGLRR